MDRNVEKFYECEFESKGKELKGIRWRKIGGNEILRKRKRILVNGKKKEIVIKKKNIERKWCIMNKN